MAENIAFSDIIVGLDAFFDVCADLGFKAEALSGRFGVYQSRIGQLSDELSRMQAGEAQVPIYKRLTAELHRYLVALEESQEIGSIVPFLKQCRPRDLTPKIKWVLSGPELPSDEDLNSNQARNFQFELRLASTLSQVGLKVELAEPDLRCQVGDKTVFFACKRLLSPRKLNKRINEATVQLRRAIKVLSDTDKAWGLIAISLSSVLTGQTRSETIANRRDGMNRLSSRIDSFIDRRAKWSQSKEAQGILFYLTSMFTNYETNRVESGSFLTLHGDGPICEAIAIRVLKNAANNY